MTIRQYREIRHPERILDARQLTDVADWTPIAEWCGCEVKTVQLPGGDPYPVLYIGDEGAVADDWIVGQPSGFHVWVPDAFPRYFEPVA
jgi:hypothetical protein